MPFLGDNESKLLASINSSLIMGDPFAVLLGAVCHWLCHCIPPTAGSAFHRVTISTCARIEILTMHQVLVGCMSFNSIVCMSVCVCECAYMCVCVCVCGIVE